MPRTTPAQQYERYLDIRGLYLAKSSRFANLSLTAQADLFDFYFPHRNLTAVELTDHHERLKKTDPSLVNRAGKSYTKLVGESAVHQPALAPRKGQRTERRISVRGIRRAEPDLDKLAKVLLDIAKSQAEAAGSEDYGQESDVA